MTSTSTAAHPAPTCPPRCQQHLKGDDDGSTMHTAKVTVGQVSVDVDWIGDGDPYVGGYGVGDVEFSGREPIVSPPDIEWINGQDLRDYIAALTQAADLLDERKPG